MRKVLFLGNSHTGVFAASHQTMLSKACDDMSIEFCCAAAKNYDRIKYRDREVIPCGKVFGLSTSFPLDVFDRIFLVGMTNPLSLSSYIPHNILKRREISIPPFSNSLIEAIINNSVLQFGAQALPAKILIDFPAKAVAVPAPLTSPSPNSGNYNDSLYIGNHYIRFAERIRHIIDSGSLGYRVILPPLSLLTACQRCTLSIYNEGSLAFHGGPRGTEHDPHMNQLYGEKMMEHISEKGLL